ncbi:hypothetical protein BLNAU_20044 [Blattamonas nauphoetae]|uniref:Uncharacterized protein n=1 Tax=Blattamonas nauphoetae TaxID=2049346 RepID=A0ABQ9WZR9_9EUKA|nr:hypothetical protein BLNAU_20044 [Blattamonas nauphoetae]
MALVYRACTGKWVYSFLDITRTSGKIAYPAIPVGAILLTLLYSFLSHIRSKCISRRHATFNASTAINEQQNDRFDDVTKLTEGSSVI